MPANRFDALLNNLSKVQHTADVGVPRPPTPVLPCTQKPSQALSTTGANLTKNTRLIPREIGHAIFLLNKGCATCVEWYVGRGTGRRET